MARFFATNEGTIDRVIPLRPDVAARFRDRLAKSIDDDQRRQ